MKDPKEIHHWATCTHGKDKLRCCWACHTIPLLEILKVAEEEAKHHHAVYGGTSRRTIVALKNLISGMRADAN